MTQGQTSKIYITIENSLYAEIGGVSRHAELRIVPSFVQFSAQDMSIKLGDLPEK